MFRPTVDTSGKTGSAPTYKKGTWFFSTDGTAVPPLTSMDNEKPYYYLNAAQEPVGPKTLGQLREMCAGGEVGGDTLIAAKGDPKWVRLDAVLHGLVAGAQEGEPGACPRCGATLQTVDGSLPKNCPACSFAVDSPHDTGNLLAHFLFTLTKKYCCFRGRATRVEFWSFQLFVWPISMFFSYTIGAVRNVLLNAAQAQAALETMAQNVDSPGQLPELFNQVLQYTGIFQPDGVSSAAYMTALGLLILQNIVRLALVLPSWGVMVRRLHDVGWSGWWAGGYIALQGAILVAAVSLLFRLLHLSADATGSEVMDVFYTYTMPLVALEILWVALAVLLLVLFLLDGKRGPNKYGPSPKYPLG